MTAPRTRTTKTSQPTEKPAKKTAAKRPARKRAPRKTTTPALSLVKPKNTTPDTDTTQVDPRPRLTVRRRLFVGPMGAHEQAAVRAALAAAHLALPVPVRAWNGSTAHLGDGTILIHNPGPDRTFTAHIACRHGAIHGWPITSATDLREARGLTKACERRHSTNTPADDGAELDWDKAVHHGIKPTSRLGEGLKAAKKATADTQPLSQQEIAEGLAQRAAETAADTEEPKEHPEP